MASTKYDFTIATDFPNGKMNTDNLVTSIGESAILIALDYVATADGVCSVWFKTELSEGDVTILGGIVAAHPGVSLIPEPTSVSIHDLLKTDSGRLEVCVTYTKRTKDFNLRAISFYTSKAGSVHTVNPVTDADFGDTTLSLWKKTEGVWVAATDTDAEKTVIDFDPTYSYEVIGGLIDIPNSLRGGTTDQWYVSSIGAPDYTPQYLGQVPFVSEVNIEAVTAQQVVSDGKAVSYMPYNCGGNPHTNRLRFILKHPPGAQVRFQIFIQHFT
jgi:hypothetical protein